MPLLNRKGGASSNAGCGKRKPHGISHFHLRELTRTCFASLISVFGS
jgi:hypothetical protein